MSRRSGRTVWTIATVALVATVGLLWGLGRADRARAPGPAGPAVDPGTVALALSTQAPDVPTQSEEIAFFERRLNVRGGDDLLARRRLAAAYLLRFRAYGDGADLDRAAEHLSRIGSTRPTDPSVPAAFASVHLSRHEFADAVAAATEALKLAGPTADTFLRLRLFDALFAAGEYEEAAGLLTLPLERESFSTLVREARLADRRGDLEGARVRLERALATARAYAQPAPVVAWSLIELAHYAHHGGDHGTAVRLYREALELLPGSPAAVEGLAWIAYAVDSDLETARRLFERALELGGHLDLYEPLIEVERALGQERAAADHLERFLTSATADPVAERQYRLPVVRLLAQRPETASRAVRLAEADLAERRSSETLDALAWARFGAGDVAGARVAAREARSWGVPEPRVIYHGGVIEAAAGNAGEARELLEEVLSAESEVGPVVAADARRWLAVLDGDGTR